VTSGGMIAGMLSFPSEMAQGSNHGAG
jgi:hypothetical protein